MTISYPLTLPTSPGITRVRIGIESAVAVNTSPWTFTTQVQAHQGMRWTAEFTLPPMSRDEAEDWQVFLLQLNGMTGTFMLGDPFADEPRGNWSGVPRVKGAGQSGQSLLLDGFVVGATVAPGDVFQIGQRMYKYIGTTNAVANGSGEVTLDIWPRLRGTPADDEIVIVNNPRGLFRLSDNQNDLYNSEAMEYYSISLSAVEAI